MLNHRKGPRHLSQAWAWFAAALVWTTSFSSLAQVTPGGLVSSRYYGQGAGEFAEVTLTIEQSPGPSVDYFWAQQFWPDSNEDHGGYFGLQTNGTLQNSQVGKMLIFSIWNADQAEAGPGATAQTFGGEGIGYSVRLAYDWQLGVPYTFRISKDGDLWWRMDIQSPGEQDIFLGRIRITEDVPLEGYFANFVEYYTPVDDCNDLAYTAATFSPTNFAGFTYPAMDLEVYGPCAENAAGEITAGTARFETGLAAAAGSGGNNSSSELRVALEEPVQGESHMGVGNLRGWAVAEEGIDRVEVSIDGAYAFDAPYGGNRADVGGAFPDIPASQNSGFSLAYNYSDLSRGEHEISVTAFDSMGNAKTSSATFSVVRFDSSFISSPDAVDLDNATCRVEGDEISLIDALIEGALYDLTAKWRVAEQGFEIIEIR